MLIDWRRLFDSQRIEWRDHGPNCSRGHINIACPFCGRDPSFHLSISEDKNAYYCFRDPRHSGNNVFTLLFRLGIRRERADYLLHQFSGVAHPPEPARTVGSNAKVWDRFVKADAKALDYLARRGFYDPALTAARFDLRSAKDGRWARRILIPYYHYGTVEGFAGRALHDNMEPKYLANADDGQLYIPSRSTVANRTLILVEGQFDALKLASALPEDSYLVAALCGKALNAKKILRLLEINGGRCDNALISLDNDVPAPVAYQMLNDLAAGLKPRYIARLQLPLGYKDPGELPEQEIVQWLRRALQDCPHLVPS